MNNQALKGNFTQLAGTTELTDPNFNGLNIGNYAFIYSGPSVNQTVTLTTGTDTFAGVQFPILGTANVYAAGTVVASSNGFGTIYSGSGSTKAPTASANTHGRICVSDAAACTSGTTYAAGGGSTACELWSNGTNWIESGSGC